MKNLEEQLSPRMRSDSKLLKIKMKRSNIQGLKGTTMKKGPTARSTKEKGSQKRICLEWKGNSVT